MSRSSRVLSMPPRSARGERFAHVAHAAKGRAAAQHDHLARRVRLVEQAVDLAEIIRWHQPSRPRLGLRAHRVMLEHLQ